MGTLRPPVPPNNSVLAVKVPVLRARLSQFFVTRKRRENRGRCCRSAFASRCSETVCRIDAAPLRTKVEALIKGLEERGSKGRRDDI